MASPSPALAPPHGQVSNFANPPSLAKWTTVCVSVCLSVTTSLFLARNYVRISVKRTWTLEDWFVCIAWGGMVTLCALMITIMYKHGGIHEWDLTLPEVHEAIFWFNAATVVYAPTILAAKLAILYIYRRVFVPRRWGIFDWTLRIYMAILILFYLATFLVKIWECNPRERIWDRSIPGKCVNVASLLNTSGLFNSLTDIIILLIPVKSVWNLNMTKKRKMGVVAAFTVGFTAPVFSMIGFVVRIKISSSPDVAYNDPEILLWAAAEVSTGLICVCVPALAPLAHRRRQARASANTSARIDRSNSRRIYSLGKKKSASPSLDEQDLWSRNDLELQQPHNVYKTAGVTLPMSTVVTGIEGGVRLPSRQDGAHLGGFGEDAEEPPRGRGILTTTRIEHSYL